jgi:RNA polymerase sigma factor (sigma-70 family)
MSDLPHFYERVIEPINDRMIRSVWRFTRNAQDAEDAMQNALLVIWKRRHRIARHAVPHSLVLKICAQAACDIARRRARDRRKIEPDDSGQQVADRALSPSEELASSELCGEIFRAINRLARSQAVAFGLRVFERVPYGESRRPWDAARRRPGSTSNALDRGCAACLPNTHQTEY